MLRFLRDNAIALVALFVALGGTTIAATQIGKNQVTSASIKDGQVKARDLHKRAVRGSKVVGSVPRAANADAVGGVARADLNRGRMSTDSTCALSKEFVACVAAEVTTPASQRLLVLGAGDVGSNVSGTSNQYTECKLQVDDVDVGLAQTVGIGSSGLGGSSLFPQFVVALNGVTEPLAAGAHKLELECRNTLGNNNVVFVSQVSAVGIGSG